MPYTCIIVLVALIHTYPLTFALTMVADHHAVTSPCSLSSMKIQVLHIIKSGNWQRCTTLRTDCKHLDIKELPITASGGGSSS